MTHKFKVIKGCFLKSWLKILEDDLRTQQDTTN